MLARAYLSRNTLNINVVCTAKRGQSITCLSLPRVAVRGVVHDVEVAAVSLRDVAESDFLPLGAVALLRLACAATALYTLLCVYCDDEGLELRYHDARVHLRRHSRWTTFTLWCFTLLFFYFAFAAYCSGAVFVGRGDVVPGGVVQATLVLF